MLRPTTEGWWWSQFEWEGATITAPVRVHYIGGVLSLTGGDSFPVDVSWIRWLGPVAPFAASPDPAAPDASDEVRLAAGWEQQVQPIDESFNGRPGGREWMELAKSTPAPGPAGLWRLHASGVWVRWVVAS